MQYKFFIDGTWQVDQEQLCVQDEYGAINNLIFVKESDSTPSALLREDTQSKLVSGFARSMHLEVSADQKRISYLIWLMTIPQFPFPSLILTTTHNDFLQPLSLTF